MYLAWKGFFIFFLFFSINCHILWLARFMFYRYRTLAGFTSCIVSMRGWNPSVFWVFFFFLLWRCWVEYSRDHELRLPIRRADWSRGADSPCFTLSLTSSHSSLKCLTQSSGNLQETDLQTCWKEEEPGSWDVRSARAHTFTCGAVCTCIRTSTSPCLPVWT